MRFIKVGLLILRICLLLLINMLSLLFLKVLQRSMKKLPSNITSLVLFFIILIIFERMDLYLKLFNCFIFFSLKFILNTNQINLKFSTTNLLKMHYKMKVERQSDHITNLMNFLYWTSSKNKSLKLMVTYIKIKISIK